MHMSLCYRVKQGLLRIRASILPGTIDLAPVRATLDTALWRLFADMPKGDQAHGVCVLQRLGTEAASIPALAQAALLHDVGKAQGSLSLVHRTVIVLSNALSLGLVERWSRPEADHWGYPFFVHLNHAEIGSKAIRSAGGSEDLIVLVNTHDGQEADIEPRLRRALALLQRADDRC